jgi:hypothetical protein
MQTANNVAAAVSKGIRPKFWKKLARGKKPKPHSKMNGLEASYAEHLTARQVNGEILFWRFHGLSFRLADGAWYTPDFTVQLPDGIIELHETKGVWREAARVRIKVAADRWPFRFVGVKSIKGKWVFEEFSEPPENTADTE